MKTIFLYLCLASSLLANYWVGSFTETIIQTNDSFYQVGQTWQGSYSYHADTSDGTFTTGSGLGGSIFMPFATTNGFYTGGLGGVWQDLSQTNEYGTLTVTNGEVTNFFWQYEFSGFFMLAGTPSFTAESYADAFIGPRIYTVGSLAWSAPVDPPEPIPDAPNTVVLCAIAMLALFAFGHPLLTQWSKVSAEEEAQRQIIQERIRRANDWAYDLEVVSDPDWKR